MTAQYLYPVNPYQDFAFSLFPSSLQKEFSGDAGVSLDEADALSNHLFAFLNLPRNYLGKPVDWLFIPDNERLWQYNLHYGEWAQTLSRAYRTTGEIRYRDTLIGLMADWIGHNPVCKGPGWDPYPLSRRIVAWTKVALSLIGDDEWKSFWQKRLAPSLHQQTRVLAANLEKDLANNHLVANYRAVAWMGILFPEWPEADKWRKNGLEGLWSEMRRQVLADGGHDERSISYHTIVLQDLLETWHFCRETGQEVPADAEPTIKKMLQFLTDMMAPDGSYPMLNDTVPGYPMDPGSIILAGGLLFDRDDWISLGGRADLSYAISLTGNSLQLIGKEKCDPPQKPVAAYPDSGYVILRGENGDCLYFDAGSMGPRHLPGHGHADILGIMLYGKGHPLIVDPGVYSYHDRVWRDHFRSTHAHSTVEIDGIDQCVFWGNFRVAYPPDSRLLEYSESSAVGEHEGYRRLSKPVTHRRGVRRTGPSEWEIHDSFSGRGTHDYLMSFQLSPGAETTHGAGVVRVRWPGKARLSVVIPDLPQGASVTIEKGWVSPGWYTKLEASRIAVRWRATAQCGMRVHLVSAADR